MLIEDTKSLSEVVVTALGIKREEKALGYSVQKIGGEALSAVKGTDVASSLTGKIAGLAIHNSSCAKRTAPGARSTRKPSPVSTPPPT